MLKNSLRSLGITFLCITTPLNFLWGSYFTASIGAAGMFVWFLIIFTECDK